MDNIKKIILMIIVMTAVIGYTIFNYVSGKTDLIFFLVCIVIMGLPLANMINILIQELKKK